MNTSLYSVAFIFLSVIQEGYTAHNRGLVNDNLAPEHIVVAVADNDDFGVCLANNPSHAIDMSELEAFEIVPIAPVAAF